MEKPHIETYDSFEQMLAGTGEYVTTVCGVSMWPMLRFRMDPVLIHPVKDELKRYDVAVYDRGDNFVVHRIIEVRPDIYVFRGDNCIGREYVPRQAVKGVVVGFWRFGRYVPVSNRLYRLYYRVWVFINPLLKLYRRLRRLASRAYHALRRLVSPSSRPSC